MWPFSGMSLQAATALGSLANWGLLIAIIGSFVATFVIVQTTDVKEEHWEQDRRRSAEKIAELNNETVQLSATAETSRSAIAQANERVALAEQRTTEARLEQERLKAQLAWRTLAPATTAALKILFATSPGKVNVQYVASDPEAQYLAIQIANLLIEAKWEVALMQVSFAGNLLFGIWIPDSQSADTGTLQAAFSGTSMSFYRNPLPSQGGLGFGNAIQGAAELLVGSKPIPK